MQYLDSFFDYLPKLCKQSRLPIIFVGFTDEEDSTIDKSIIQYCKTNKKFRNVILYVREKDFNNLDKLPELRICHAFCVSGNKMNPIDKFIYCNTLKLFMRYLHDNEKIELDWDGDIKKPLYIDTYYDLTNFTFDSDDKFTPQFVFIIKEICKQCKKSEKFAELFVEVLYLFYKCTGIVPHMIEEDHYLNYASNTILRKLSIKKLQTIIHTLQEELKNDI